MTICTKVLASILIIIWLMTTSLLWALSLSITATCLMYMFIYMPRIKTVLKRVINGEYVFSTTTLTIMSCCIRHDSQLDSKAIVDGLFEIDRMIDAVVKKHHGQLINSTSISIVAYWSYSSDIRHVENTVVAAKEILSNLIKLKSENPKLFSKFDITVCIDTGECDIGIRSRFGRSKTICIGTVQSLIDRMMNCDYKVPLLISEAVLPFIPQLITVDLDIITHPTTSKPVVLYTSLGNKKLANQLHLQSAASQHTKFRNAYIDGRLDMAIIIAGSLRTGWQNQLKNYYDLMISNCKQKKQSKILS